MLCSWKVKYFTPELLAEQLRVTQAIPDQILELSRATYLGLAELTAHLAYYVCAHFFQTFTGVGCGFSGVQ